MFDKPNNAKWIMVHGILLPSLAVEAKPKPPKMAVVLAAQHILANGVPEIVEAFLVLPDGSKAVGRCLAMIGSPPCQVESFKPEKRVTKDCVDAKHTFQGTCFINEDYYADRFGNDVVVYGANGKVTYHLTGSWDHFEEGVLPRSFDPNWTAVCVDGTFSYSQQRSGTCSDHGGVQAWRSQ